MQIRRESTNMKPRVYGDILYPELSYKIVGSAFHVWNEIGEGHSEKHYQRALALAFEHSGLQYEEQVAMPLKYTGRTIGKNFLDFLVHDKIVVEIKRGDRFSKKQYDQVREYLRTSNLQLGLLIGFGNRGVTCKRIANSRSFVDS